MDKYCQYVYASPLGNLLLNYQNNLLFDLRFEQKTEDIKNSASAPKSVIRYLDAYFSGCNPQHKDFQMQAYGTPFQQVVWETLLDVPYGETTTYGIIAQQVAFKIGRTHMSAQAIGQAVGKNPIAILIPCHRVICANGNLGGYAWGITQKKKLLQLENDHF